MRALPVPPFMAADVNHRVLDSNYPPAPGDYRASPKGMLDCFVYKQSSSLSARAHCSGGCAQYSNPDQCAYSEEHPLVKHSQHTINPLITPHINPFLP
ncbi:unnamed protein product, partial [Staurois parvus]